MNTRTAARTNAGATAAKRLPLPERLVAALGRAGTVAEVVAATFPAIAAEVPFAFGCMATTDPITGVITWPYKSHPLPIGDQEFSAVEYGEPDVNQFTEIARRPSPVGVLSLDTGGHPERCRRFRDYLAPHFEFSDEVRLVVRADRLTWAALALYRGAGEPPFTNRDAEQLVGTVPAIAGAVRRTLFAGEPVAHGTGATVPEPAVIVVDGDGRPVQLTRAARDRIDDLGGWDHGELPAGILAVAAKARTASGVLLSRARLVSGQWLTLRASALEPMDDESSSVPKATGVVVTMDLARPAELTGLTLAGHGLTTREQEIANLVVKGASTKAIASALHLSPHTVQDHLKAIFTKLDVNSRRQLVGQLYG